MRRLTIRISTENKSIDEVNRIIQSVLLYHKFVINMKNGKLFWTYGNPDYEIIPCISSEIDNQTLILKGWMYDKEAEETGCSVPYYALNMPVQRMKRIMSIIACVIKYGKSRKA